MTEAECITVLQIEKLSGRKRRLRFDNADDCIVYLSEIRGLALEEGREISIQTYQYLIRDVIGKRAKKRALHLLEQMDRTEQQLREKLLTSGYPQICVDSAIDYVKSFHYLDDRRYAQNFTRYRKENLSRMQIQQKLMTKGVARDLIADAIESEYDTDESLHIRKILEKKHFSAEKADDGEFRRVYNYLMRRGFRSTDILEEMKHI